MSLAPIPFEARRFRTAAAHYLSGRPAYAPALFARVAACCGLDRHHAVLDLGCGPGQLARLDRMIEADGAVAEVVESEALIARRAT